MKEEPIPKLCPKCGKPMEGKGKTYATEKELEKTYVFCANVQSGCYGGW